MSLYAAEFMVDGALVERHIVDAPGEFIARKIAERLVTRAYDELVITAL